MLKDRADVQLRVAAAATALLATALLGMGLHLLSAAANVYAQVTGQTPLSSSGAPPPAFQSGLGLVINGVGLASGLVVSIAVIRMKRFTGHAHAIVASILAMLPCISPCCFLGLPIGAWSLMTLLSPDVRAAFDRHPDELDR